MAFQGALVKKASNQTGANYSAGVNMTFDTDVYDYGGWHDTGSNTDRLVVPAGVTRVRLAAQVRHANVGTLNITTLRILDKNGAALTTDVVLIDSASGFTNPCYQVVSPVLNVVAGDFFTLKLTNADTSIDITAAETWFAIEAVDMPLPSSAFSGAAVKKANDQTTADYSAGAIMAFDAEDYDTNNWHDNSTFNSRLTVPSGVSKVRVRASIGTGAQTSTDWRRIDILKNGAAITPAVVVVSDEASVSPRAVITSPVLDVVAGDYFELKYQVSSDTSITIVAATTSFSIEKVE